MTPNDESEFHNLRLGEQVLPKFHVVDDAIRHDKFKELLRHVEGPVNLSEDSLLSVVTAHGKSKLVIKLLEKMPREKLKAKNFNGDTALHVAAAMGDESVVEALVEKNGDLLKARNQRKEIPLHRAALFGQRRIFWKLLELASSWNDPDIIAYAKREDGANMLHCAVMGNAPELALEIAKKYPKLMTGRNVAAVTPLQIVVTIPELFRSQSHLGPLESLIYDLIPLEERHEEHVEELEELSVHETSDTRYEDDECWRKFPRNYATFFDMLELACIPVKWARILVFNILKQLCTRIQHLELLKKNHKQTMEFVAYVAKDPNYWDFIGKGRVSGKSENIPTPSDMGEKPPIDVTERSKRIQWNESPRYCDFIAEGRVSGNPSDKSDNFPSSGPPIDVTERSKGIRWNESPGCWDFIAKGRVSDVTERSKGIRWNESPLILGAEMGLHEFVKQILTVYPASAAYLDTQGRNVFQVAILHGQEKIVEIIESMVSGKNPVLPSWLLSKIEEKTKNTILHFAAVETVKESFPPLQMQYELQWFERVQRLVPKDLAYSRNEGEKTAQELFNENHATMVEKGKAQLMEMGKTCSSLVAAVVFASSFSIPGEKDANNNPVFLHKTAFKVFSHAYVVGLSCAATALVLFLSLLSSPYRVQDFRRSLPTKYFFANVSFFLALVALLVAFTCNIYLNIYGGRKAETKDIVPLVCELTIFPTVCIFVLLYRGSTFGFGSFMRHVWR